MDEVEAEVVTLSDTSSIPGLRCHSVGILCKAAVNTSFLTVNLTGFGRPMQHRHGARLSAVVAFNFCDLQAPKIFS